MHLTDLSVQKLKEGLYFDQKTPGFGIRVGKNRKTWLVVRGERRKKIKLGHYPTVSLSDARKKAMAALAGPVPETRPSISFDEARTAFLAQDRWRPQSKRVLTYSLNHFSWKRPVSRITHEDVVRALDAIKGPSARAHALSAIRAFFNWCVPRYLASSPCVGIRMEKQPSRDRVLSDDELKAVWKAAESMGYPFGTIVQLLILTGQRKMEIGSLQWSYIGEDTITLPKHVTKNGREHTIPLSDLAYSVLPKKGKGYLFRATGSEELYNGYGFHLERLQELSGTSGWTLHDLRRTFATTMASLSVPLHVTEKLLNHVSGSFAGVVGIYQRYSYFDEMREACEKYEAHIRELVRE